MIQSPFLTGDSPYLASQLFHQIQYPEFKKLKNSTIFNSTLKFSSGPKYFLFGSVHIGELLRRRVEQTSLQGLRVGCRFAWDKVDRFRSFLVLIGCREHPCLLPKSLAKICSSSGVTAIFVLASSKRPLCWSDPGSGARNIWSLAGPGGAEAEGWSRTRSDGPSPSAAQWISAV